MSSTRAASAFALAGLALVCLAACQSTAAVGATCTRASDCTSPLTCTYGRCRPECAESRDCPVATRCIAANGIGVCTLDVENHCDSTVCPAPLRCVQDQCRTSCSTPADCLHGDCPVDTCIEPTSGEDAGAPLDAGEPDTGQPPGACVQPATNDLLVALGSAVTTAGLRVTSLQDLGGVYDSSTAPVLALTAFGGEAYLATTGAPDSPFLFHAALDGGGAFLSYGLYDATPALVNVWSIDLSSAGMPLGLLAAMERGDSPVALAHDSAVETDPLTTVELPLGSTDPQSSGGTAIVGGRGAFGTADVPVFYVFHTNDPAGGDTLGALDGTRQAASWRTATGFSSSGGDYVEMAPSHGRVVVMRDHVGALTYWQPEMGGAAHALGIGTLRPAAAASPDGSVTLAALAGANDVALTRIACPSGVCDSTTSLGNFASGAEVHAVALTTLPGAFVLAVARVGSVVDLHLLVGDTTLVERPFPSVPGADGGTLALGSGSEQITELRIAATPIAGGGATIVVAARTATPGARIRIATYRTCAP